ncbi:MAG: hypothetical protein EOM64_04115 [Erysipelotrichia bacterium]|nr:hypothetical protein [Erysipelotrichia bacterium]
MELFLLPANGKHSIISIDPKIRTFSLRQPGNTRNRKEQQDLRRQAERSSQDYERQGIKDTKSVLN